MTRPLVSHIALLITYIYVYILLERYDMNQSKHGLRTHYHVCLTEWYDQQSQKPIVSEAAT